MTRTGKRDFDRNELKAIWKRQAAGLGFEAKALAADAMEAATGERVSALEGIGAAVEKILAEGQTRGRDGTGSGRQGHGNAGQEPRRQAGDGPRHVGRRRRIDAEPVFGGML